MSLVTHSQDSTEINLTPHTYLIDGDTSLCWYPNQAKEIRVIMEERNTFHKDLILLEKDKDECDALVNQKNLLIESYKADSVDYLIIQKAQSDQLKLKDNQITNKDNQISDLEKGRTRERILAVALVVLAILL